MAVAMADFFISCIANVKDLDIKGYGDTNQGMVSIDINIEFAHFHDQDISLPVRCIDFNGHTRAVTLRLGQQMLDGNSLSGICHPNAIRMFRR